MQFANTEYLIYALWLAPAMLALWLYARWRKRKINSLAQSSLVNVVLPGHNNKSYLVSGIFLLLAMALIVVALANPVGTSKPVKGKTNGLDIVFALDVSKSMDAQDIKPSRLQQATHIINQLTEKLAGNKLGLVLFAGNAYVQMPLTSDANAMRLFLANINTNMIPEPGTALESAIETSKELLLPNGSEGNAGHSASKIIILITDGEDHGGDADQAAKEASKDGVVIMAIGMGTADGAPIPLYSEGLLDGYMKDNNGETVVTKLAAADLKNITNDTHGTYYASENDDNIENELIKKLNSFSKGEETFELFDIKESRFQWFAGAALFLLLMEMVFTNGTNATKIKNEQ